VAAGATVFPLGRCSTVGCAGVDVAVFRAREDDGGVLVHADLTRLCGLRNSNATTTAIHAIDMDGPSRAGSR
jgi:hypothetical protein